MIIIIITTTIITTITIQNHRKDKKPWYSDLGWY